jgi:hypothetical protein
MILSPLVFPALTHRLFVAAATAAAATARRPREVALIELGKVALLQVAQVVDEAHVGQLRLLVAAHSVGLRRNRNIKTEPQLSQ